MCFSRQSFCKTCKKFLRVATLNHCKLFPSGDCERRLVYSKFFEVCESCQGLKVSPEAALPFIPRVWVQKGPVYETGFSYDYVHSNDNVSVLYNGFHVIVHQKGKKYIFTIV